MDQKDQFFHGPNISTIMFIVLTAGYRYCPCNYCYSILLYWVAFLDTYLLSWFLIFFLVCIHSVWHQTIYYWSTRSVVITLCALVVRPSVHLSNFHKSKLMIPIGRMSVWAEGIIDDIVLFIYFCNFWQIIYR